MTDFKMVPLVEIQPDPNQPRKFYDETAMQELIASIAQKGVLQPILIRPHGNGLSYILVCGERRYRAASAASLREIPAVIRELTDEEALELQIIENLQRKDVHPMEEAIAFKSLVGKFSDLKELAARVGKSPFYIKQRIKLCDLVQEWQQAYYANRISSKIAVTLATFDEKMQKEMWKERGAGNEGAINIDDWFINRFRGDLKKATFKLDDITLDRKAGPCSTCQFNSAVASLFPEAAENPICSNKKCYLHKTDVHFDHELKKAKDEPDIIFVNVEYWETKDNLIRALKKEGHTILNGRAQGNFELVNPPGEPPSLNDYIYENYENEAQRDDDYQDDLKIYEKALAEYNNKVAGGKYKTAFCIHGDHKGKYVYLQIKKGASKGSSTATKDKEAAGKLTSQDITDEIKRIQDRDKRAKEIDVNKSHRAILEALGKHKTIGKPGLAHQGKADRGTMVYLLLHEVQGSYQLSKIKSALKKIPAEPPSGKHGYALDYFNALAALTDDDIAFIIRTIVMGKWGNPAISGDVHKQDTALRLIAEYAGIDIAAIEAEQATAANKRQERVVKRIAELQAKRKELAKPASKNEKTIKALTEPKKNGKK